MVHVAQQDINSAVAERQKNVLTDMNLVLPE